MAISDDLFLAILAMDSYNRGYNAGVTLSDDRIGDAELRSNSSNLLLDSNGNPLDQPSSFFAQAYTWTSAQSTTSTTVISYRGTDAPLDSLTGWVTGGGAYRGAQAQLAADFYKALLGSSNPQSASVEFTGHSLGGAWRG